jgi:hypothetical protein
MPPGMEGAELNFGIGNLDDGVQIVEPEQMPAELQHDVWAARFLTMGFTNDYDMAVDTFKAAYDLGPEYFAKATLSYLHMVAGIIQTMKEIPDVSD